MSKTIWKFDLEINGGILEMPKGSEILSMQTQNETLCLWALVDPDAKSKTALFLFGLMIVC